MKSFVALLAVAALLPAQAPIRGFIPDNTKAEQDREAKAKAVPAPERVRAYMQRIAATPHAAGSPASKAVADYTLSLLKDFGLDARIENYEALLPYPTIRTLEMVKPVRYVAKLKEPVVPEDPNSGDANQLPTYNAYSATGSSPSGASLYERCLANAY